MRALDYENPWVDSVTRARRAVPALGVALVGAAIAAGVVLAVRAFAPALAGMVEKALAPASARWREIGLQGLLQVLVFGALLAAALVGCAVEGRTPLRTGDRPALALPAGVLLGALGLAAAAGIAWAMGAVHVGSIPPFSAPAAALAVGVALVAFQSLTEEVFFRGWIQPVASARWGPWVGLAVTSGLFAALHIAGGARSPVAMVNLFLGGLMFGLLALRTGGLMAPAAAHIGWNGAESCVLGLDPNPGVAPTGSLIDLDLSGPALWSGGADTLNGSLAASIVLGVIVAALAATPARRAGLEIGRPGP